MMRFYEPVKGQSNRAKPQALKPQTAAFARARTIKRDPEKCEAVFRANRAKSNKSDPEKCEAPATLPRPASGNAQTPD